MTQYMTTLDTRTDVCGWKVLCVDYSVLEWVAQLELSVKGRGVFLLSGAASDK